MTWIPLLLADPSACLRQLVLRELLDTPADEPELQELESLRQEDDLAVDLFKLQQADGSWKSGSLPGTAPRSRILTTAQVLARLGYIGFNCSQPVVARGVEYLFSLQEIDGRWPLSYGDMDERDKEGYTMVPLQTALPLRSLALCGCAQDPRAEKAYDWLLDQRLEDGAWPVGIASGNYGYIAGYRRLAHSRWGCRSNTTGVLACLALHPTLRSSPEARRALDLLLGRETRESCPLGFEVARLVGAEETHGFITFYARFDLAQILDLCWRIGIPQEDERVDEIVRFVRQLQGSYGLWEYGHRPQASRWVTFDLLRSLARLSPQADWLSSEPRTPFQPYPKRQRRY
jgi:hypothetical protein